jgi:signal peptidase I
MTFSYPEEVVDSQPKSKPSLFSFLKKAPDSQKGGQCAEAPRRSEKAGIFHFTKDMVSALAMALIAIVYVIQAFKIPTGSMENSLLVGDFLLGLKFIYGAPVFPFCYTKFPGITNPKPGDVIIFKYPGADKKDYIKRCVAGPGQTIQVEGTTVTVDGKALVLPPRGQYIHGGQLDPRITHFEPLRIPKKGDTLTIDPKMPVRQFLFYKHLVKQEHPRTGVTVKFQLYINGIYSNSQKVIAYGYRELSFDDIPFDTIDNWIALDEIVRQVTQQYPDKTIEVSKLLFLGGNPVKTYTVRYDNYFMMGDNRDNSTDSRYWGFLNRNFIKAKAFILYFSEDKDVPLFELPIKIRWNRIGKLIRGWDGVSRE